MRRQMGSGVPHRRQRAWLVCVVINFLAAPCVGVSPQPWRRRYHLCEMTLRLLTEGGLRSAGPAVLLKLRCKEPCLKYVVETSSGAARAWARPRLRWTVRHSGHRL